MLLIVEFNFHFALTTKSLEITMQLYFILILLNVLDLC